MNLERTVTILTRRNDPERETSLVRTVKFSRTDTHNAVEVTRYTYANGEDFVHVFDTDKHEIISISAAELKLVSAILLAD